MNWPRENFNDILSAMVTVFIVIIGEDWNSVMFLYTRALAANSSWGRQYAIFYFVSLFSIGNIILLALFTALLLKSHDMGFEQFVRKIMMRERKRLKKIQR